MGVRVSNQMLDVLSRETDLYATYSQTRIATMRGFQERLVSHHEQIADSLKWQAYTSAAIGMASLLCVGLCFSQGIDSSISKGVQDTFLGMEKFSSHLFQASQERERAYISVLETKQRHAETQNTNEQRVLEEQQALVRYLWQNSIK